MSESGFDELIVKLREQHPAFYKYNHIYAEETSKVHDSLRKQLSGATGSVPEVETYNKGVFEVENEAKKLEEEMLKNYWGDMMP
jgi:hypothetical protein